MNTPLLVATAFAGFFGFIGSAAARDPLAVGEEVPSVSGMDQDGNIVDLKAATSKGFSVVYFYPKADTPGCTAQACSLRDAYTALTDKGITVYGVSVDKPEAQKAFKEKYHLPFTLIADSDKKVIAAFGVPTIPIVGFASREAYFIKDGKVIWRDLKAKTKQQADDILAAYAAAQK